MNLSTNLRKAADDLRNWFVQNAPMNVEDCQQKIVKDVVTYTITSIDTEGMACLESGPFISFVDILDINPDILANIYDHLNK